MKAAGQLQGVASLWDKAQRIKTQEGLRQCLVYTEGEIRHLVSRRALEEATALTRLYANFCNREATLQSLEDAVVTLRHAKGQLDYMDREYAESKHYPESLFRLMLLTCNNLANVLKSLGDTRRAYHFLSTAHLLAHSHPPDSPSTLQYLASTHVNLSTLHLELHQPLQAITSAEHGLRLLQMRLARAGDSLSSLENRNKEQYEGLMQSYLSAMFNIAIAEERLGRKDEAVKSYMACLRFAKAYMPQAVGTIQEAETAVSEILEGSTAPPTSSRPQLTTRRPSHDHPSEKPLSESLRLNSARSVHKGDRYYSNDRLQQLRLLLKSQGKKPFLSSSQYFDIQIRKNLRLDSDLRHLTPMNTRELAKTLKDRSSVELQDKKSIASLRQRKYHRKSREGREEQRGEEHVKQRMWALRQETCPPRLTKASSLRPSDYTDPHLFPPRHLRSTSFSRLQIQEEIERLMLTLQTDLQVPSTSPDRVRNSATSSALAQSIRTSTVPVPPSVEPPLVPSHRSARAFKRTETST